MWETALAAFLGAAIGAFYFGGLWLTVRRLPHAQRPALLMLGSFLMRVAVCLPAFYLAARGENWGRLLVLTAAFLTVRLAMVRRLGPEHRPEPVTTGER